MSAPTMRPWAHVQQLDTGRKLSLMQHRWSKPTIYLPSPTEITWWILDMEIYSHTNTRMSHVENHVVQSCDFRCCLHVWCFCAPQMCGLLHCDLGGAAAVPWDDRYEEGPCWWSPLASPAVKKSFFFTDFVSGIAGSCENKLGQTSWPKLAVFVLLCFILFVYLFVFLTQTFERNSSFEYLWVKSTPWRPPVILKNPSGNRLSVQNIATSACTDVKHW